MSSSTFNNNSITVASEEIVRRGEERRGYLNKLNKQTTNNKQATIPYDVQLQGKVISTFYIPRQVKHEAMQFADWNHVSFSQLIVDSLNEYMENHAGDLPFKNVTVNIIQPSTVNMSFQDTQVHLCMEKVSAAILSYQKYDSEFKRSRKDILARVWSDGIDLLKKTHSPELEKLLLQAEANLKGEA